MTSKRPASRTSVVIRIALLAALIGLIAFMTTQREGGLSDDQKAAVKSSKAFMQAVVDDDSARACQVMAFDGMPVKDDEALSAPCAQGVAASPDDKARRSAYRLQLDAGHEVSEVKGDTVTVTWGDGDNTTKLTVVRIDGEWFVTY